MTQNEDNQISQHIGNTILVVMMDVESGREAEFDRWYNEEHLPERLEIPGYVSCLLYTSPSPRDLSTSRMPSSA